MKELKNCKIDDLGQVILTEDGLFDLLYSGQTDIVDILVDNTDDIQLYNNNAKLYGEELITVYSTPTMSKEEFDLENQAVWLIPEEYQTLDIDAFILNKCSSELEIARVKQELVLFKERQMEMFLRALIYIVDIMRANNIVWGVGRGSSCASYCLYLIGIHKVNSIQYKLDISEFLK
jgi:DNA polymerase III alpha subunit